MKNLWTIRILLLALIGTVAQAGPEDRDFCGNFAKLSPDAIGSPAESFLKRHHPDRYTHEIESPAIRDQCGTSGCWAFQAVARTEREVEQRTGKKRRFSEAWLILNDAREKAYRALYNKDELIDGGSTQAQALFVMDKYGVVPANWKPRVDIFKDRNMTRLTLLLNQRLVRYHRDVALVPEKRKILQDEARADIDSLVDVFQGKVPRIRKGLKTVSPKEWADEIVPKKYHLVIRPPEPPVPPELAPKVERSKLVRLQKFKERKEVELEGEPLPVADWTGRMSWEQIDSFIIRSLEKGNTLSLAYESDHNYIDWSTGIMSLSAFPTPDGLKPLTKPEREYFGLLGTGHAVELVGVDVKDGKIVKLLLRNSHGSNRGDEGYLHMYTDYFREYLKSLSVRQNAPPPKNNAPPPKNK